MRDLTTKEVRKRGCWYCADMIPTGYACHGYSRCACVHDVCPYHILDDEDDFLDWLRKIGPIRKTGGGLKGSHL